MYKVYMASNEDLEAIEDGIRHVWHPKMDFVFRDKSKIENTIIVSYDSKAIYLWSPRLIKNLSKLPCRLKNYYLYVIFHRLKIIDKWQYAWRAGMWDKRIENLLPKSIKESTHFEIPRISGGLLTPFIKLQKTMKGKQDNPYITKESYLATIIHEFGHVYWNSYKMWWPSDKKENLFYLKASVELYQNRGIKTKRKLSFSTLEAIGEMFAFCTEYYASQLFFPSHKENIDRFNKGWIKTLIRKERKKDLEKEDSVVEPKRNPHTFAMVFGRIILNKFPETWPSVLTNKSRLKISL